MYMRGTYTFYLLGTYMHSAGSCSVIRKRAKALTANFAQEQDATIVVVAPLPLYSCRW
jgi:hypothetical protein